MYVYVNVYVYVYVYVYIFPGGSVDKGSTCSAEDLGREDPLE